MSAFISKSNDKIFQVFELIPLICENIEILNLTYSPNYSDGIVSIDDTLFFDIVKLQTRLLEFKLVGLPKIFEQLKKHENSLKDLSLVKIDFKEITTKKECLPRFKNLENLSFKFCGGINSEQLKIIFGNNSNRIKQLGLFVFRPDQLQSELFGIIGSSLQSLALNNFRTEIIESIIRNCPNITELTISNDKIPLIIPLVSKYSSYYRKFNFKVGLSQRFKFRKVF